MMDVIGPIGIILGIFMFFGGVIYAFVEESVGGFLVAIIGTMLFTFGIISEVRHDYRNATETPAVYEIRGIETSRDSLLADTRVRVDSMNAAIKRIVKEATK